MDRGHSFKREPNPKETTNIISLLSFFYFIKVFKKGYAKGIHSNDLFEVLQNCRSKELGDLLEQQWQVEEGRGKSLCRALWHAFGQRFLKLGLMQLVVKLTITIWSPQAFSKLISYFSPAQTEISKQDAVYYAGVVIGLRIIHVFFSNNYTLALTELGLGVKAAVCSLIYRKSLRLNSDSLSEVTVGKITTIINKDVDAFQDFIAFGNDVWIAFIQTGIICYLVYSKIGVASWAGVTFFLAVLPFQIFIGKLAYNFRLKCNKKTDERLELTQEVLSAIKIIKMYTWEKYFETKICKARKEEVKQLHRLFYAEICITIIGSISTKVAFFIFLMTYVYLGYDVTAEVVFYILSCFYDLEYSLSNIIPFGFSQASKLYATAKRCESVLNCNELQKKIESGPKCSQITFKEVGTSIGQKEILKNVNLALGRGLNIVTGFVGSGKTVFLKTIMQECPFIGEVTTSGRISYASQEPWLFPSTIKNNVLFGENYSTERYKKVLQLCCLDYDLALLPFGDNTVIGDRGINLSKGQQSRINLARAVYKESDIYLLDDCLASLDSHVSDKIFETCICNFLQNKLVVFVTNNLNYVQKADVILEINQGSVACNMERKSGFECLVRDFDQDTGSDQEEIKNSEVYHESKNSEKVSLGDYHKYVTYGGGLIVFCLIMVLFTTAQASASYSEKLMTNWVTLEQNLSTVSGTNSTDFNSLYRDKTDSLTMYSVTFVLSIVLTIISALTFFYFARVASINMHKAMLHSVINTTMHFFDSNFIGNILTRFSKDCVTADEQLPVVLVECLRMIFIAFGGIVLITTVNYLFLLECLVLLVVSYLMKRFCQPTSRNLQRLHVQASIPMIGHVNSTLGGLTTIRACNAQEMVIDEFDKHQNLFTSASFMLNNSLSALSFGLDLFSALFVSSLIIQFLVFDFDTDVGDVGLAITQSFTITSLITIGISNVSDCENLMTSVERILEYVSLEQEGTNGITIKDWPRNGLINFNQIALNYGGSKSMLDDINFTIQAREKVGIVGRTGAGKSSIISSLLRLYPTTGKITIDGVDIEKVSLTWLRRKISVIPQDPFLFSGTIRENMDPLSHYTDEQIWKVLTNLGLNNLIDDLGAKIDKGSTLSAGQKQLFYLARVILQKNKIVVLDEATANVDPETDVLINEAVANHFGDSTVIVIAHRLSSVMSCNKIIVLSDGRVRELDEPEKLLQNKNSFFHSIIK